MQATFAVSLRRPAGERPVRGMAVGGTDLQIRYYRSGRTSPSPTSLRSRQRRELIAAPAGGPQVPLPAGSWVRSRWRAQLTLPCLPILTFPRPWAECGIDKDKHRKDAPPEKLARASDVVPPSAKPTPCNSYGGQSRQRDETEGGCASAKKRRWEAWGEDEVKRWSRDGQEMRHLSRRAGGWSLAGRVIRCL
ncbi:hypothetical protein LZ30DRAFT_152380 [Colletotrichum cereale]|nr:hypothetical protein LZ30DRAFT_152380 [Colletotrichum cereale]